MPDIDTLNIRIQSSATSSVNALENLVSTLERVKSAVGKGLSVGKIPSELNRLTEAVRKASSSHVVSYLNQIATAVNRLGGKKVSLPTTEALGLDGIGEAAKSAVTEMQSVDEGVREASAGNEVAARSAAEMADQYVNATSKVQLLEMRMEGLQEKLTNGIAKGANKSVLAQYAGQIQNLQSQIEQAKRSTEKTESIFKRFGKVTLNTSNSLGKLVSAFGRIALYRFLRTVIKSITQAFSEGIHNVREYSKAIGGSFDKAMTKAEGTMTKFKNSLGAAVAPAIQALIPILQTVVNWAITAINYLNQFFALLGGQGTWTAAAVTETATALSETKEAATGAGKAIKGLLADWDELNIIQSQSGGGGGGGGAGKEATEYGNLFKEMNKFSKFLLDNFERIKRIVIEIGAALAAWSLSGLFGGWLSTLLQLAAAGLVIAIEFDLSYMLNSEYLKTGDVGWLIADALTTAVGTTLAWAIAKHALGGSVAPYIIPISLLISAFAGFLPILKNPDVSTFSKENLIDTAWNAIKAGTAGAFLFRLGGLSMPRAILGGAGAALFTFGAVIGLKAILQAKDAGYDDEYVKGIALSSLTMGGGITMALVGSGKLGLASAAKIGLGAVGIVLGVGVGIQAIASIKEAGYTAENIRSMAISSILMGLGAGAIAWGAGAAPLAALSVAAAAGAATVFAIVGVSALLKANKDGIKWGNEKLTEQEIQDFAAQKMFTADVNVTLNLIRTTIENVNKAKADIQDSLANINVKLRTFKLGINKEQAVADLKEQIFGNSETGMKGLIGEIREYASQQVVSVETTLALVPVKDDNGQDRSGEILSSLETGWADVTAWFDKMGNDLGVALSGGIVKGYEGSQDEVVAQIVDSLTEMTKRITEGKVIGDATGKLVEKLSDLDQGSASDVIDAYKSYAEDLQAGLREMYGNMVSQATQLESFYRAQGDDATADIYKGKAEKWTAWMMESLESATQKMTEPGRKLVMDMIKDIYSDDIAKAYMDDFWENEIPRRMSAQRIKGVETGGDPTKVIRELISEITNIPYEYMEALGTSGLELLPKELSDQIVAGFKNAGVDLSSMGDEFKIPVEVKSPEEAFAAYDEWRTQTFGTPETLEVTLDTSTVDSQIKALNPTPLTVPIQLSLGGHGLNNRMPGFLVNTFGFHADGGFPTTGSMFVARENGPEMVGTIGNKTAVANNDQIVSGVASGVAAGQSEQNSLLRQQNDYLRRILAKESTVRVEPSSSWGKFNRRSNEMYTRSAGR